MKRKDPATNNQKYLAIFLAGTMFLSAFMMYFYGSKENNDPEVNNSELESNITTYNFSQIQGMHIQHEFNSIADGLEMSPEGVVSALYVDLQKTKGTPLESVYGNPELINSYFSYGADVTKRYSAIYENGSGFELHQIPDQKISIPPDTRVVPYEGYQILYRLNGTYMWNLVGSPVAAGPIQNLMSVVDVLEGNATASSEYDQLLSLADSEDSIFQEVDTKTNDTAIPADKYYRNLKKLDDGSYMQEYLFLNPESEITERISTLQANCTERGVAYNVTNEGNVTKLIITADFESLYTEDNLLFG
jgi:hypothetical protein